MEKKMADQQAEMDEMRKRIADLELTSVYVADKVDSVATRKHTFWKNDSDIGVVDDDDCDEHNDVLNTAFISDDEDDEYDDVPDLIECSDSDDDEDDDDTYGYLIC